MQLYFRVSFLFLYQRGIKFFDFTKEAKSTGDGETKRHLFLWLLQIVATMHACPSTYIFSLGSLQAAFVESAVKKRILYT